MQIDKSITLSDVIGCDDAKKVLIERLSDYFKYKDKLKSKPSKGVLLYGYPGVGKTMLVQAAMNSLGNSNVYFRIVSSSDITAYVGTTEDKIKKFLKECRKKAKGKDIVLLMDEVDQLIPKKTSAQGQGAIVSERISALLRELDGIESNNNNIFIIATTNHPGKVEEAFLRSGRIDEHIYVGLPDEDERQLLVIKYMGYIPGFESFDNIEIVAKDTPEWTGADYKRLGNKLELEQLKQGSALRLETIMRVFSEVDKQRKRNFKFFEAEYKQYRENQQHI